VIIPIKGSLLPRDDPGGFPRDYPAGLITTVNFRGWPFRQGPVFESSPKLWLFDCLRIDSFLWFVIMDLWVRISITRCPSSSSPFEFMIELLEQFAQSAKKLVKGRHAFEI